MHRPASFISVIFLLAIAMAHVFRIMYNVQIVANDFVIPMWPSVVAVIAPAALSVWLLKERRSTGS